MPEREDTATAAAASSVRAPVWPQARVLVPTLLAITVVAYLAFAIAHAGALLESLHGSSDVVGPLIIGEHYVYGRDIVTLGNKPLYSTLFYELATRWLPAHRLLWQVTAPLEVLAAIGLVVDATRRIVDWLTALALGTVMLCLSPTELFWALSLGTHTPAWLCMAAVGWLVVLWATGRRSIALVVLAVLFAALVGASAASDRLTYLVTLVPLVAAVVTGVLLERGRGRTRELLTHAAAFTALVLVFAALMRSFGNAARLLPVGVFESLASPKEFIAHVPLLLNSYLALGNGNFFSLHIDPGALVVVAAALLLLAAPILGLAASRRAVVGAHRRQAPVPTAMFAAFWAGAGIATVIGFLFSSAPEDLGATRYLGGLAWAALVLAALASRGPRGRRAAFLSAAIVVCVAGMAMLARFEQDPGIAASEHVTEARHLAVLARRTLAITRRYGAGRGYGYYWDAGAMMYLSGEMLHIYPVEGCGSAVCAGEVNSLSSWYRPHGGRTFLVTNAASPQLTRPPQAFGKPLAAVRLDAKRWLYIYSYDVAARVRPLLWTG